MQTHIQVYTDSAIVDPCNIARDLVVDRHNILDKLSTVPYLTNPTLTGTCIISDKLFVAGGDIIASLDVKEGAPYKSITIFYLCSTAKIRQYTKALRRATELLKTSAANTITSDG